MTFAEIEALLGFALPSKSKGNRPWWSNNPNNNVMTKEWLAAGFKTEQVDVEGEILVFRRITRSLYTPESAEPPEGGVEIPRAAKLDQDRDPLFGCMKDVTWIEPGVDLTQPADPEWADLIEDPEWHP